MIHAQPAPLAAPEPLSSFGHGLVAMLSIVRNKRAPVWASYSVTENMINFVIGPKYLCERGCYR